MFFSYNIVPFSYSWSSFEMNEKKQKYWGDQRPGAASSFQQ